MSAPSTETMGLPEAEYLSMINAELTTSGLKPVATLAEARKKARGSLIPNPERKLSAGNGNGVSRTGGNLATPAQVKFFVSLMLQKMGIELNGSQVEDARNLSKKDISANIEELKGMPNAEVKSLSIKLGDTTDPFAVLASYAQVKFLTSLLTERDSSKVTFEGAGQGDTAAQLAGRIDKKDASRLIDFLVHQPKAEIAVTPAKEGPVSVTGPTSATVELDGIYVTPKGEIFKVQFNRGQGDGRRLYAKQLIIWVGGGFGSKATEGLLDRENGPEDDQEWEYRPGMIHSLKAEWRLTPEQAIAWGALYGTCVRCHRDLTLEKSIRLSMGTTCAKKQGF